MEKPFLIVVDHHPALKPAHEGLSAKKVPVVSL